MTKPEETIIDGLEYLRIEKEGFVIDVLKDAYRNDVLIDGINSVRISRKINKPTDRFVYPHHITEEMVRFATNNNSFPPVSAYHVASNLNAMLRLGYCKKCGLVPSGCLREGCCLPEK